MPEVSPLCGDGCAHLQDDPVPLFCRHLQRLLRHHLLALPQRDVVDPPVVDGEVQLLAWKGRNWLSVSADGSIEQLLLCSASKSTDPIACEMQCSRDPAYPGLPRPSEGQLQERE